MDEYILEPGDYIICDPAYITSKNQEGRKWYQQLMNAFYQDMNAFHKMRIDQIEVYMFRSLGGDGIFDGVATDSGTIVIMERNQLNQDPRFKQGELKGKIKLFHTNASVKATVHQYDLIMSNGIFIHTT